VPRSRGGGDERANIDLSCKACNGLKGSTTDAEFVHHLTTGGFLPSTPGDERARLMRHAARVRDVRASRVAVAAARAVSGLLAGPVEVALSA
jgi:hypothetical protein